MKVRDFAKVAVFNSEYASMSIYDESGMIDLGYFNSVYPFTDDNPVNDLEIVTIKSGFSVIVKVDKDTALKIKAENDALRKAVFQKNMHKGA